MKILAYTDLLQQLTVDCQDNGTHFTRIGRINVLQSLLSESSYQLIHEGNLSLVYAKSSFLNSRHPVLISSPID